jgi:parvulin-like peptidyl-prolyl isomerase
VEAGEITIYQAAQDHSVAPDAAQNLGEIGWVAEGKLKPDLNKVVFGLEPGEIGGPIEAGGLWHIVLVQDVRDAENTSLEDERTRKLARRQYIHEKLDDYVVDLRKNVFDVVVYEDAIIRLAQQEADMVKELNEKGKSEGSITKKRVQELEKFIDNGAGAGPSGT